MNQGGAYDDYTVGNDNYGDNYTVDTEPKKDEDKAPVGAPANDDMWGAYGDPEDLRQPAHSSSVDQTRDLDEREAALVAKEKALMEKNQRLVNRDRQVNEESIPEDNWPFALYAITYHSIKKEIPQQHQAFIRNHYRLVKLTMFTLFWNACIVFVLYLEDSAGQTSTNLLWSVIYTIFGIPGAWKLWYRAIFNAVKAEKTFKFLQYFTFGGAHTIFCIVACIGITDTSLCGFLMMVDTLSLNTGIAVCAMIAFASWIILTLGSIAMMRRTWSLYRNRGGDLKADAGQAAGQLAAQGLMNA